MKVFLCTLNSVFLMVTALLQIVYHNHNTFLTQLVMKISQLLVIQRVSDVGDVYPPPFLGVVQDGKVMAGGHFIELVGIVGYVDGVDDHLCTMKHLVLQMIL